VSVSQFTSFLDQAISSRFLPDYTSATGASSNCAQYSGGTSGTIAQGLKITSAAGGAVASVAGSAIASGAAIGSTVPLIGTIVGVIGGILSTIFAHHAAAVVAQDEVLCQAVPQTNSILQQIDQLLASGQLAPADASTAYQQVLTQFSSGVHSDPSFKTGDALYGYLLATQAVIAARVADLQAGVLTGGAPGPWTQPATSSAASLVDSIESVFSPSTTTAAGTSSLLPWLVLGGAALLFLM
jgi:hypothetical protein